MADLKTLLEHLRERTKRQIEAFQQGNVRILATMGEGHDETPHYLNFLHKQLAEMTTALEQLGAHTNDEVDASLEGTFPASDPSASHLPDVIPSNADEKWEAAATAAER